MATVAGTRRSSESQPTSRVVVPSTSINVGENRLETDKRASKQDWFLRPFQGQRIAIAKWKPTLAGRSP